MAVKGEINLQNGIELKECYAKVKSATIKNKLAEYTINYYANENSRKKNLEVVSTFTGYCDIDIDKNVISQVYDNFKSKNLLTNQEDC